MIGVTGRVPLAGSTSRVRPSVGLVGAGVQMRRHLVPALRAYGVDIAGVFDIDPIKSAGLANELGVEAAVSLRALLERPVIDCLVAACTPQGHEDVISSAVAHGVPVLVEKPPVRNLNTLRRLSIESESAGVPVCVGMNYRHTPGFVSLQQFARADSPLHYIHIQHLASAGAGPSWGLERLRTLMLAQAVHALDLALLLVGGYTASTTITQAHGGQLSTLWTIRSATAVCNVLASTIAPGFRQIVTAMRHDGAVAELTNLDQLDVVSEAGYRAFQHLQTRRAPFADVLDRMGYASTVAGFLDTHVTHRLAGEQLSNPVSLGDLEPAYMLIEQAITAAHDVIGVHGDD
ncbi:Gfo/Idh/MocA family oxidoreductase [Dactylosporangium sp. NPDC051485]|uniref:Gfo/Idh/MocA family protein n=1 Tax=Dactylosporangium sp. NPDC051485 TaxID=3154846 RepID=UPI003442CD7A